MREILRRIRSLEQRVLPSEAERLPRLPEWWLREWEAHLAVPVHEYGLPKFAAVRRDQAEQRPAADFVPGGTEEVPAAT
jgi:hypothetical protein